jgi:tripartite-type tricarboxylate transporter receptor subunit TctC
MRQRVANGLMTLCLVLTLSGPVTAQDSYPSRPITLVNPYPPGGGVDKLARALAGPLQRVLKQPVVVDYRTGAAAAIGTASVAHALPDGYTIMIGAASTVTIPEVDRILDRKTAYAYTVDQLVGVALLSSDPTLLVVHPALPVKTAQEFIAFAKAHPGGLVVSSGGYYGPSHLPMALLEKAAGVRFRHLIGTGGGPALSAVLSGNAVAYAAAPAVATPHIDAGRVRVLAQWGTTRSPEFPDVPTWKELGLDLQFTDWYAVFAPARTPPEVLDVLRRALRQAVQNPEYRAEMSRLKQSIDFREGDEFQAWYAQERKLRTKAVRAVGRIDDAQ